MPGRAEQPAFYVDDRTPELSIRMFDGRHGEGIEMALLETMAAEARRRRLDLCLNVRDNNAALRLDKRVGFQPVRAQKSAIE